MARHEPIIMVGGGGGLTTALALYAAASAHVCLRERPSLALLGTEFKLAETSFMCSIAWG